MGAFPKAVGAAGELVVTDNNKAIILEAKKVNNSKIAAQMAGVHISASFFQSLDGKNHMISVTYHHIFR